MPSIGTARCPCTTRSKSLCCRGSSRAGCARASSCLAERELAKALGVSLAPVRQAMVDLTKEGYVDRTRGKGTFVRERKLVEKIQILGSFHASMQRQGLAPDRHRADRRDPAGARGGGHGPVPARSRRLVPAPARHAGRAPLALLTAWLPARLARGMSEHDLGAGSLYDALAEVHGIEMTSADNLVEVGPRRPRRRRAARAHTRLPVAAGGRHHPEPEGQARRVLRRALPTRAVPIRDREPPHLSSPSLTRPRPVPCNDAGGEMASDVSMPSDFADGGQTLRPQRDRPGPGGVQVGRLDHEQPRA